MANIEMPKITLGDPVVVSRAPVGLTHWGPWQFPTSIERLADGRLHLEYHAELDAAAAYGLPTSHALSSDNGETWSLLKVAKYMCPLANGGNGALLLPNGDRLRIVVLRSCKLDELPEPFATSERYGRTHFAYRAADLPEELRAGWHFARLKAGGSEWVEESATVRIPGEIRGATEGLLVFPWVFRWRLAPDGSIWGLQHGSRIVDGQWPGDKCWILVLRSTDDGRTWDLHSEIPYQPDKAADSKWDQHEGFTEPDVSFMPDGSVLCLIRTGGPLYWSRSLDDGKTWSTPRVFDDVGVWPQLLTLENGVTLASYGRPGMYVRATADPSGLAWGERVTVVQPGERSKDTCSYSGLLALDDDTALLAYSDFNYPDEQGQKRKTILVRRVTVS